MDRLDQHGDNWRNIQLPIPLDEPRNTPTTAKPDKNQHQKTGVGSTTKVWYWIQPEQLHSLVSTDWMLWQAILHTQFMQYSSLRCSNREVHEFSKSLGSHLKILGANIQDLVSRVVGACSSFIAFHNCDWQNCQTLESIFNVNCLFGADNLEIPDVEV